MLKKYERLEDNKGVFFEEIFDGHLIKCRLIEGFTPLNDFYFNMDNFKDFKKVFLGNKEWLLETQMDMANALNVRHEDFRFDIICNDVCIFPDFGIDWCAIDHIIYDYRHDYKKDIDFEL